MSVGSSLKRKRGTQLGSRKTRKVDKSSGLDVSGHDLNVIEGESSDDSTSLEAGEEWGGIEESKDESIDDVPPPVTTKSNKPPTGEELRVIRDATDLFRTSSFKLQIDALLPNVRPKLSRTPPLERFLFLLHNLLNNLPSTSPQHPLEASRRLLRKGVSVPYALPLPTEDTKWKVGFEKPSDITLVGSWPLKTSVKAMDGIKFRVDVAVEMPDDIFQEKDYLEGRFFQKRAFYLATIASAIKTSIAELDVDIEYDSLSADTRLTVLLLTPLEGVSQHNFSKLNAQVCIIPVLSHQNPIPLHRLSPSHSNVRSADPKLPNHPTPIYNTCLLMAFTPKAQMVATHAIQQETAFTDAVTLLRIWANQRGYGAGSKICVSGFERRGSWWNALISLVITGDEPVIGTKVKRRPSGRGLSSYQVFRAALDFLSKHDFCGEPVFVKSGSHLFPPEEYRPHHEITFVDSVSKVNLLAGIPLGSIELLRHDARKTLEALDYSPISADPFSDVFLTDHRDLPSRFDTLLRVDLSSAKPLNLFIHATVDYGSPANALMASLSSLLHRGLGDRTKAVSILHKPSLSRPVSQAHPSNSSIIYIGLIHNPTTAYRLVDHGPAAEQENSEELHIFRDFWGEKAELRRFKDGRILESVVWDVATADERAHIPGRIVRHILARHFALNDGAIQTWQTSFDSLLRLPEAISSKYISSGITTGFKGALSAFDNVVRMIKGLDKALPLAVLNISPISEQLRYTSVFSPVPLPPTLAPILPNTARYLAPIHLVLEFEKSSRWPDDLKAIQSTKLAFFERIASELMSSAESLKANVIIGDGVSNSEIMDKSRLEIVTPEGWAFSISIWNDREAILLDRSIEEYNKPVLPAIRALQKGKEVKDGKQYREAVEAKEVYTRRFIHAPRHHRAIAALCHQYTAFSGTVRLVKRWLAAHWLLHGHVTEEAVELICAALFVGDGRFVGQDGDSKEDERETVPGSKERGFASIIAFLKDWKWEDGLFVSLYGVRKPSDEDLPKPSSRGAFGMGVWHLSTDFDKEGRIWTLHGPDNVVARRVQALAKATWDHLQGMEDENFMVQPMFIHPTDNYDFIVHLEKTLLPRYFHNVAADAELLARREKYVNLQEDQNVVVRPGFDPAHFLFNDLKRIYSHTLRIFHDSFGGESYGVIWDPSLRDPRPFRALNEFSSIPVNKETGKRKEKGLVALNESSILCEIERLGASLVKGVTVHVS